MNQRPGVPVGLALVAALVLAVVIAGCVDGGSDPEERSISATGNIHRFDPPVPAPALSVTSIDGEAFTLADQQGRVVLLVFFGVGCSSCLANLPDHRQLYGSHGQDERFVMAHINAWSVWYGEGEEQMKEYREREEIGWRIAPSSQQLNDDYGVRGTPTHVFIDHEGNAQATGSRLSYGALSAQVDQMLDEIGA